MSETNSADKKADDNTESAETIADIDQFVNPKSWPVFILSGLLGLPVILVLFAVFQIRVGDLSAHPLKAAFIVYLGLYIGMCALYFWSKSGPQIVQVGSLRRLLLSMSTDWTDADTTDNDETEKLALEKAKTTITSVAMLISVAFLQLMQINSFYQDVLAAESGPLYDYNWWYRGLVFLGFGCSFFAFAGFLITADSLDSMFNTFRKHDNRLHRYFYRSILYQRYLSVIALITALILIVTFLQPAYGILSIILLYNMGRRHWFPSAKLLTESWDEKDMYSGKFLHLIGSVVPLLIVLTVLKYLNG